MFRWRTLIATDHIFLDPVDELQSIGAKDVESIAFVLVIIGDELVAIKKIYVQ
jgi:hypothetical protein